MATGRRDRPAAARRIGAANGRRSGAEVGRRGGAEVGRRADEAPGPRGGEAPGPRDFPGTDGRSAPAAGSRARAADRPEDRPADRREDCPMSGDPPPRFGLRNLLAGAGLLAWAWYLAANGPDLGLPGTSAHRLITGLSTQALWFAPVGALVILALPRPRSLFLHLCFGLFPALLCGAAAVTLIAAAPATAPWTVFETFVVPEPLFLAAPFAGMFAGSLLGLVLARGVGSALLVIPVLLAVVVVLVAIVAVALLLLTDRVALARPAESPEARSASPGLPFGGLGGLTWQFQEALLSDAGDMDLVVSLPWRAPVLGQRYFNFTGVAEPRLDRRGFEAGLTSLAVGGVPLPGRAVRLTSDLLSRWINGDPRALGGSGAAPIESVWIEGSRVLVELGGEAATEQALAELAPLVSGYLDSLEREAALVRSRPDRLAGALERGFALAAARSAEGGAVRENRALLLALGAAGGHPSLLSLAGIPVAADPARRLGGALDLTLHGQPDRARHFLLSAGLTQVGEGGLTAGAGLLKERLDSAAGGSGFSFADLLMDAAGARLGTAATASEDSARRVQARLAAGVTDADLAPEAAVLPEGFPTAVLAAAGPAALGAADLRRLEAEITRRVEALPLYDPSGPAPLPRAPDTPNGD